LEYVLRQGSPADIKNALSEESLPNSLPDAYDKVMKQMEESKKKFAFQIMSWIFHAARRLTIGELCEALAITNDSEDLQEDLIPEPDWIISTCESLVEVDKFSREVRFTHQTVDDFLRGHCTEQMLSTVDIAKKCLTYLAFSGFDEPCRELQCLQKRLGKYRFGRYAAQFWGLHMQGEGERRVEVRERLYAAFKSAEREYSLHQLRYVNPYYLPNANGLSFLHIIAMQGLATICKMYLDDDMEEMRRYVMIIRC
jgi:hypothetical protein